MLSAENLHWNGPFRDAHAEGPVGDEQVTADTRILEHGFDAEEIGQSFRRRNLNRLVAATRFHRLAHALTLCEEMDDFVVSHCLASRLNNIEPSIRHGAYSVKDLLLRGPLQEFWEDFLLKDLDKAELTTALDFETLELCDGAVKIEDRVPFLQHLVLLCAGRQHHGLVWTVNLKQDGVLTVRLPLASLALGLVLVVRVLLVNAIV
mmetsp:Transcript_24290/g.63711  ORF Transcript_24290/g.63711 Transcript_24290/m.63711 type:complete len:206 (-) Transcript_24290:2896-3513(-)